MQDANAPSETFGEHCAETNKSENLRQQQCD